MVKGFDLFQQHFDAYAYQFILIGTVARGARVDELGNRT